MVVIVPAKGQCHCFFSDERLAASYETRYLVDLSKQSGDPVLKATLVAEEVAYRDAFKKAKQAGLLRLGVQKLIFIAHPP